MTSPRSIGILLVDDEPDLREALAQMLIFLGHRVVCADAGEQAVAMFGTGEGIDLVVTDLSMPGMGGAGLVEALRRVRRDLPVIVFSGLDESFARSLISNFPNIHFLKKPFTFQTMTDAIEKTLPAEGQDAAE